jgi:hypothetical protein
VPPRQRSGLQVYECPTTRFFRGRVLPTLSYRPQRRDLGNIHPFPNRWKNHRLRAALSLPLVLSFARLPPSVLRVGFFFLKYAVIISLAGLACRRPPHSNDLKLANPETTTPPPVSNILANNAHKRTLPCGNRRSAYGHFPALGWSHLASLC